MPRHLIMIAACVFLLTGCGLAVNDEPTALASSAPPDVPVGVVCGLLDRTTMTRLLHGLPPTKIRELTYNDPTRTCEFTAGQASGILNVVCDNHGSEIADKLMNHPGYELIGGNPDRYKPSNSAQAGWVFKGKGARGCVLDIVATRNTDVDELGDALLAAHNNLKI